MVNFAEQLGISQGNSVGNMFHDLNACKSEREVVDCLVKNAAYLAFLSDNFPKLNADSHLMGLVISNPQISNIVQGGKYTNIKLLQSYGEDFGNMELACSIGKAVLNTKSVFPNRAKTKQEICKALEKEIEKGNIDLRNVSEVLKRKGVIKIDEKELLEELQRSILIKALEGEDLASIRQVFPKDQLDKALSSELKKENIKNVLEIVRSSGSPIQDFKLLNEKFSEIFKDLQREYLKNFESILKQQGSGQTVSPTMLKDLKSLNDQLIFLEKIYPKDIEMLKGEIFKRIARLQDRDLEELEKNAEGLDKGLLQAILVFKRQLDTGMDQGEDFVDVFFANMMEADEALGGGEDIKEDVKSNLLLEVYKNLAKQTFLTMNDQMKSRLEALQLSFGEGNIADSLETIRKIAKTLDAPLEVQVEMDTSKDALILQIQGVFPNMNPREIKDWINQGVGANDIEDLTVWYQSDGALMAYSVLGESANLDTLYAYFQAENR